jgi:hypothetical protein
MTDVKLKDKALDTICDHSLGARSASVAEVGIRGVDPHCTPVEIGGPDGVAILQIVEAAWNGSRRYGSQALQ